ncbi:MAG: YfhO family protein [Anaerolineales bacterium]|jgi:hypothetical protein
MAQRSSRFAYLVLFVFPFTLFAGTILGRKALFWGTPLNQFVPWWAYAWDSVNSGLFPLWNNLLGMSAPLAANYQSALFYPLTWLYYLVYTAGGTGAMAWFLAVMVVLHLFWAGLGMALLVRELKLGRFAQIVAGLSFSLSGYLVARAGFLSINAAAAWLPWVILGGTKLVNGLRPAPAGRIFTQGTLAGWLPGYLLLVFSFSMQLLAGHAQTAWYSLLLALIWVVYFSILDPWFEKKKPGGEIFSASGPKEAQEYLGEIEANEQQAGSWGIFTLVIMVVSAIVLAVGLSAVQLLPTAEYLLESQRAAAVDYEFAMTYSFWPWRFLSFIAPGLFGNPGLGDYWGYANYWEDAIYIGLVPFVLAIAAIVSWGRNLPRKTLVNSRLILFLVAIILFAFLMALGKNTPVFPWLYRNVPTFDMFQAPTRFSILAIFAFAILAAVGAESWTRPKGKKLYWLRLGVMAAAAITIGALLALFLSQTFPVDIRTSFIRGTVWLGLWAFGLGILALKSPPGELSIQDREWSWWQWGVIGWIGVNLVIAGWGLNPSVGLDVYTDPLPTAEKLRLELDGGRIYLSAEDEEFLKFERFLRFDTFYPFQEGEDWQSLRASLLPNITLLDQLNSANNFDPLLPGRYSTWMEVFGAADPELQEQMLNLMGVTVVESIDLNETNGIRFDSRKAYPRFRWASCGIQVDGGNSAIDLLRSGTINHDSEVILESGAGLAASICQEKNAAEIQVIDDQPNGSLVQVKSPSDGYLVIADVWYPGWRAYVDGDETIIRQANYLFRAIELPSGQHEVRIVYRPKYFYVGIFVSGAGLIVLIVLVLVWLKMKIPSAS